MIAVRINNADTTPALYVLPDAVLEKIRFATAGVADDVHVLQPRLLRQDNRFA